MNAAYTSSGIDPVSTRTASHSRSPPAKQSYDDRGTDFFCGLVSGRDGRHRTCFARSACTRDRPDPSTNGDRPVKGAFLPVQTRKAVHTSCCNAIYRLPGQVPSRFFMMESMIASGCIRASCRQIPRHPYGHTQKGRQLRIKADVLTCLIRHSAELHPDTPGTRARISGYRDMPYILYKDDPSADIFTPAPKVFTGSS